MAGKWSGRRLERAAWIVLGVLGGAALLVAAGGAERAEPVAGRAADAGTSEAAIARFAGGEAERCVASGPDRKLCSWRIPGRLLQPGEPAYQSGDGVNLICSLPRESLGSEGGSCRAHARGVRIVAAPSLPHVSASGSLDTGEAALRQARRVLEEARTVTDLSHLVGALPDRCTAAFRVGKQSCEWRLQPGTSGHERLASLAGDGAASALRCILPVDGSTRGENSCTLIGQEAVQ